MELYFLKDKGKMSQTELDFVHDKENIFRRYFTLLLCLLNAVCVCVCMCALLLIV